MQQGVKGWNPQGHITPPNPIPNNYLPWLIVCGVFISVGRLLNLSENTESRFEKTAAFT